MDSAIQFFRTFAYSLCVLGEAFWDRFDAGRISAGRFIWRRCRIGEIDFANIDIPFYEHPADFIGWMEIDIDCSRCAGRRKRQTDRATLAL